jgi:hypothetical protein
MEKIPEILKRENKEKFRRRWVVISRIIAIILIISIFWFGYVQMKYAKEYLKLKEKYGSLAHCYLCGLENYRSCTCNYIPELFLITDNFDRESFAESIAIENIEKCNEVDEENETELFGQK